MGKIGANYLLPKALKSCPKSKISPNQVTLLWLYFVEVDSLGYRFKIDKIVFRNGNKLL